MVLSSSPSGSVFAEEGVRSLSLSDTLEESEPPEPLPPFMNHWLDEFTSWTTENKLKALDAIIPLYVNSHCIGCRV